MKISHLTAIAICAGTNTAVALKQNVAASTLSQRSQDYLSVGEDRQPSFSKRLISNSPVASQRLYRRADLVRRAGQGRGRGRGRGREQGGTAPPVEGLPPPDLENAAAQQQGAASGRPEDAGVTMTRSNSGNLKINGKLAELPLGAKVEAGDGGALISSQQEERVRLQPIPGTNKWQTEAGLQVFVPERSNPWERLKDKVAPPQIKRTNSGRMEQHNVAPGWYKNYVKPVHTFARQCTTAACLGLLTANQVHSVGTAATVAGKALATAAASGLGGLTAMESIPPSVKVVDKAASGTAAGYRKLRPKGGVQKPARHGPR